MGFYAEKIMPRLIEWTMSGEPFSQYRRELLADTYGQVLEIGFGTGLNLAYYPEAVDSLTIVDPNPGMGAIVSRRVEASAIPVDKRTLSGEALPMADGSFDCVVSTWTLCSIPAVDQALQEIHRVLKPGGKFFFIEHGLSPEPGLQTWQNRLTPLQKVIADGCHLNRQIQDLVEGQFEDLSVETFYAEKTTKILGYLYRGVATKLGQ
ncbi:SAM-dependent methyltransferase [filamentous cyanobacterium CCP5]|nr:SAM-dependent methyltransferase [filamentous cyanobacterium CCP5]